VRDYFDDIETKLTSKVGDRAFYRYLSQKFSAPDSGIDRLMTPDNICVDDDLAKAELLADQFSSVFKSDDGELPNFPSRTSATLDKFHVDPAELCCLLAQLPAKYGDVPDGLPAGILRSIAPVITYPLSLIMQRSVHTGSVPRIWKSARVSPLFKSGDKTLPINYRPISLTSHCGKILEKLVKKQLVEFLESQHLLSEHQHGFRAGHSTTTLLVSTLQQWAHNVSGGKRTTVVYLDFAKAFDTVVHGKLLLKLEAYGISGEALAWIRGFLALRDHYVCVNGASSSKRAVPSGVIQGSVLGPVLFSLFVNDLVDLAEGDVNVRLFADDAKLYAPEGSPHLQETLNKIAAWCKVWQLDLAPQKCLVMSVGRKTTACPILTLGNVQLTQVNDIRDLGVYVSSDLSCSPHCGIVAKKARRISNWILKSLRSRNIHVYVQAFKSYVLPILEYASPAWNPFLSKDVIVLESVCRYFTRRAMARCNMPNKTYGERLHVFKMDTLEVRRCKADLKLFYRILHGSAHCDVMHLLRSFNTATRGHKLRLQPIVKPSNNKVKFSYLHRTCKIWNQLPPALVECNSFSSFCTALEKVCIERMFEGGPKVRTR
jgi:hypothetical protein